MCGVAGFLGYASLPEQILGALRKVLSDRQRTYALHESEIAGRQGFWQPAMQVNYPNEEQFTRIVEIKHATGQDCEVTTIVREYPADYQPGGEAHYPIPAPEAQKLAERYRDRARREAGVSFVGRLANYRYFNMDQIVALALAEFRKLAKCEHEGVACFKAT